MVSYFCELRRDSNFISTFTCPFIRKLEQNERKRANAQDSVHISLGFATLSSVETHLLLAPKFFSRNTVSTTLVANLLAATG